MTQLTTLSSIKHLAQNACYAEGWEFYQQLSVPSPEDDRWAGICLWNLGRLENARVQFTRAKRRGDVGAIIGLASISRLQGLLDECEAHLETAFDCALSPDDWVRALRERGDLQVALNQIKAALGSYNDARLEAELCHDAKSLLPMINQSLGYVHHLLGNDRKAKELLDQALDTTNLSFQAYIRVSRILVCIYKGDFLTAKDDLCNPNSQKAESLFIKSLRLYTDGIYKITQNNFSNAHLSFRESIDIAEQYGFIEIECLSKLGLCKAHIGLLQLDEARATLRRAEHLDVIPQYQAARDLTAGLYWTKVSDFEKAHGHLVSALEYYETHECARELGWTHLHFAVWHFKNGNTQAAAASLEQVADIAGALDNTAFLVPELRLISDLEGLAKIATPYGLHALRPVFETNSEPLMPLEHRPVVQEFYLQAFGNAGLLANGKPVHLNSAAKTCEVLAYLMMHPMSTLEKILTDVFEDSDPKAGRNYFHQIKHQLVLYSNGLQINYDRITRTYTLEAASASLSWDYSEIMRLLSVPVDTDLNQALNLYAGAFLRHSSAEWVEEVRSNVEWLLVRTGLKVVQDLFERGDFDACRKMTERLRKVEPLDESLNELLVRATTELEGALAGRRTVAEVERTFGGYGEVLPPTLKRLREELKLTLN